MVLPWEARSVLIKLFDKSYLIAELFVAKLKRVRPKQKQSLPAAPKADSSVIFSLNLIDKNWHYEFLQLFGHKKRLFPAQEMDHCDAACPRAIITVNKLLRNVTSITNEAVVALTKCFCSRRSCSHGYDRFLPLEELFYLQNALRGLIECQ